jgi:hypothetical protein
MAPTPTNDRDRQFHILMSDQELQDLKELSEAHGMSASDYVRMLLGHEFATYSGEEHDEQARRKRSAVAMLKAAHVANFNANRPTKRPRSKR